MMAILCTMPGRFGDILWALPTVRAISETYELPVDLVVAHKYAAIIPLIEQQPYIRRAWAATDWDIQETAPMTPRIPPTLTGEVNGELVDLLDPIVGAYDRIYHLSYTGWPSQPLPFEIHLTARLQYDGEVDPLDLDRPWVHSHGAIYHVPVVSGFSDEHFELKVGLFTLLKEQREINQIIAPHSRWATELDHAGTETWIAAAALIAGAKVFLGCNSGMHVLACALGKPVVMMEPNVQRHHPIFYPFGTEGRVLLVRGLDGQPTFDARHVAEALKKFA